MKLKGVMGADMNFFSNLEDGFFRIQEKAEDVILPQQSVLYRGEISIPAGVYYAQFACSNWLEIRLNGTLCNWAQSLKLTGRWRECRTTFHQERCPIQIELKNLNSIPVSGDFKMRLLDHAGNLIYPEMQFPRPADLPEYQEEAEDADLEGFHSGVGASIRSGGRFGYTKGDGVLDY
ncbi:MAG: hypothetical protein EOM90_19615, partial [Alphaproteobacteria bacterium]|nr:hypothetical protein [Alphaproteobacteria bacterium]